MGFDVNKTKFIIHSKFSDVYRFGVQFGNLVGNNQITSLFGEESVNTPSKMFYRGALQLASILMLQTEQFGGIKHTLVPVSVDQHPYILLARDVAKQVGFTPSSEIVIQPLLGGKNPLIKMSSSDPQSAIFITDTSDVIKNKINKSYTGSLSTLEGHRRYGAIPNIYPVFQILRYHHDDTKYVQDIESKYSSGKLLTSDLKKIVIDFTTEMLQKLQKDVLGIGKGDIEKCLLSDL